jgi:hypothetical protein
MSTPPIDELMKLWRKGELTAEQAAGYMMQHLVIMVQWRAEVERRLRQLEQPPGKAQS